MMDTPATSGVHVSERGRDIVEEARGRLEKDPLFRGRSEKIRIDARDGKLILQGRLPSYYLKSRLQAIFRDFRGITGIDNRIDVLWPET